MNQWTSAPLQTPITSHSIDVAGMNDMVRNGCELWKLIWFQRLSHNCLPHCNWLRSHVCHILLLLGDCRCPISENNLLASSEFKTGTYFLPDENNYCALPHNVWAMCICTYIPYACLVISNFTIVGIWDVYDKKHLGVWCHIILHLQSMFILHYVYCWVCCLRWNKRVCEQK